MEPKNLMEVFKLTYDFDYARTMAKKMVDAAYPDFTEFERVEMMGMTIKGFQFSMDSFSTINKWSLAESTEFVELFGRYFLTNNIAMYDMVNQFLERLAVHMIEFDDREALSRLPTWFRASYLNPALAV